MLILGSFLVVLQVLLKHSFIAFPFYRECGFLFFVVYFVCFSFCLFFVFWRSREILRRYFDAFCFQTLLFSFRNSFKWNWFWITLQRRSHRWKNLITASGLAVILYFFIDDLPPHLFLIYSKPPYPKCPFLPNNRASNFSKELKNSPHLAIVKADLTFFRNISSIFDHLFLRLTIESENKSRQTRNSL